MIACITDRDGVTVVVCTCSVCGRQFQELALFYIMTEETITDRLCISCDPVAERQATLDYAGNKEGRCSNTYPTDFQ